MDKRNSPNSTTDMRLQHRKLEVLLIMVDYKTCIQTRLTLPVSESSLMYAPPQSIPSWKFTSYLERHITKLFNGSRVLLLYITRDKVWTHWMTRGSSLNTKGLSSIAEMAWCLARDFSTRPWSPGTLFSFSCSTAHFPAATDTVNGQ